MPWRANADDLAGVDGAYGRLRADTTLSLEAACGIGVVGNEVRPAFSAGARIRALDMTGVFISYDAAFGSTRADALGVGVDLRPLMFARIFSNWEVGPRWLDLMVDSIGIELGVALRDLGATWNAGSGLGFVLGGGVELPLVWSDGTGLTARLGVRWIHSDPWDAEGAQTPDMVQFTLGIVGRTMVNLGLVRAR